LNAKGFHRTVGSFKIFVSFFTSFFTGSLTLTAYSTIQYSIKIGEKTESLFFYMWPFHLLLAIGMGLMCVVSLLQFIEDIHSYIKGDHFTDEVEVATDV
jgi:TRAP-type C4-dicarboxylate transport system permease small subunit